MNETVEAIHESPAPDDRRTDGNASVGEGLAPPVPDDHRTDDNTPVGAIHESPVPDDRRTAAAAPEDRHADEDRAIRAHFDRIWDEAQRFAQDVPGFDLAKELQDDGFAALLSPQRGLTLEQAYFVRHGRALLAAAERAAEARVSAALQASRRVPAPLGTAAASPGFRWDAADAKAREALKARIRKGEKIYPGR